MRTLNALLLLCLATVANRLAAQGPDAEIKAKIDQRDQLWEQANEVANAGKLDEATDLFERVYKIEQKILGEAHEKLLSTLGVLVQVSHAKQDHDSIVGYRERQLVITAELYGKDDYRTQNAVRAVLDAKQMAAFTPQQKSQLNYADALNLRMNQAYQAGQYAEGIKAATECLAIRKQVLGEQHPHHADSLHNLAALYSVMGDYPRAEPLYRQAMAIRKKVLGKEHPDYANSLHNLALLHESVGDYPRAEPLYRQAMAITEKVLGKEHPDYASSLHNLAGLYYSMGDYPRAEPLRREAVAIWEKVLGKEHPRYASSLDNLALLYESMGDYPRAEPLYREAMAIREKVLGKEQPDYARSLNNLAGLYYSMGDYPRAEPLYRETVEIYEKVLGKEHPDYATSLNNLGELYRSMDDYRRAEPLYREALAIREKALGKEHPDYATSLISLALLYRSIGDFPRAEPLYREAVEICEKVQGKEHSDYATSLSDLAGLYYSMGDYPRAEPLYREVVEIQEKVHGKEHPDYASSLNNLAELYRSTGDYRRAEPLYREALAIREKALGKEHPNYATILNNLALLYRSLGDYSRAEPLYREAIAIWEKVLGKEHPLYATSLNNLALLYVQMSDYPRAEPLYREAMAIFEKVLGKEHPDYARSLNNLAGLYYSMGDYRRAEPLYREAIAIYERVLGKEHPHYASSLSSLALLHYSKGDYSRAEPQYLEAMAIREKALGKEHPDYAASLNNLAGLYESTGDYPRAELLYREAIAIYEKGLGKEHPDYASSLNNLAALYYSTGDYPRSEPLYREAVEITLRNLELTADVQSQRQQVRMGESLRYQLNNYLSLATREPKFQESAYAALLRWKGSVWQRQLRQRLLVDQPSLQPRFAALQAVSSQLSALILSTPDPNQRDAWHRQLDELTDQREKLERDLSVASVAFRQSQIPVTPEQLRASLPAGTMLVDFLEYDHFTPANKEQQAKESWERRLLVHLVRADQEVRAIDLGPVEPLSSLVQTWRRNFGGSRAASEAARELRERIWEPLEEQLTGITTVYVSPDGVLGQFPLGALPGKAAGTYLLEEMVIIMLPVPQGLPAMASIPSRPAGSTDERFCLVGGVDYERVNSAAEHAPPETPSTPASEPTMPTSEPSSAAPLMLAARGGQPEVYSALPGTTAEIEAIESLIRMHRPTAQATILRGGLASEAAFARTAPGHRYLHVATHGFFAPETVQNLLTASSPETVRMIGSEDSRSPQLVGQHPDLLSGLVFAGANHAPATGPDDGILTAAEVQSLDLRGVDLAILSACETGLGKTAGGEGIIGLQRAFQLAGVRTTITSLWQVDDAATQALMVEFYRNLFERKLSKFESLRQAQIWLLNNPNAVEGRDFTTRGAVRETKPSTADTKTRPAKSNRSLPAYWAAFQLSGDPR